MARKKKSRSNCCSGNVAEALQKKSRPSGRLANRLVCKRDFGSGGRDRTYDQLINSQLLYR